MFFKRTIYVLKPFECLEKYIDYKSFWKLFSISYFMCSPFIDRSVWSVGAQIVDILVCRLSRLLITWEPTGWAAQKDRKSHFRKNVAHCIAEQDTDLPQCVRNTINVISRLFDHFRIYISSKVTWHICKKAVS